MIYEQCVKPLILTILYQLKRFIMHHRLLTILLTSSEH